jgi:uncharacterized membrane protein
MVGGLFYLMRHGGATTGVLREVLQGHCREFQFGLLLLIATPVARVAFSVFAFALQRDKTFVAITLLVLGTLIYSLGFSS